MPERGPSRIQGEKYNIGLNPWLIRLEHLVDHWICHPEFHEIDFPEYLSCFLHINNPESTTFIFFCTRQSTYSKWERARNVYNVLYFFKCFMASNEVYRSINQSINLDLSINKYWISAPRYVIIDTRFWYVCGERKPPERESSRTCVLSLLTVSICVSMSKGCSQTAGWPLPGISASWGVWTVHTRGAALNRWLTGAGNTHPTLRSDMHHHSPMGQSSSSPLWALTHGFHISQVLLSHTATGFSGAHPKKWLSHQFLP